MAPWLETVSNVSGKNVYIYMSDGKAFELEHEESVTIKDYITADVYTKFERDYADEQGYLLKYDTYNIMINDTLGYNNSVADFAVHTWYDTEYVSIKILPDGMMIWCTANDLGIYQPNGQPKYFRSVLALHNESGGVTVTGLETVAGERKEHVSDVQKIEDEDEGAPSKD